MRSLKKEEHLIFKIGNNCYSIEVSQAYSIVEMSRMKSVFKNHGSVIGYVTQHNIMFPVVDIHSKLGVPEADYTDNTCVLVLELTKEENKFLLGVLIDSLLEISEIKKENILNITETNSTEYFVGTHILKNNEVVRIINPDAMFSAREVEEFNTTHEYRKN
jgi:purine-binding chemotaxis protein CheW